MPEVATVTTEAPFTGEVKYYEARTNQDVVFQCNLAGTITWQIDGKEFNYDALDVETKKHYTLAPFNGVENAQLTINHRTTEDDHGIYNCSNGASTQAWKLMARPHAKLPTDSNVVEGQKLKLTCKMFGRPYPAVQWTYSNVSDTVTNGTEVTEYFGDRVKLETSDQGVVGGDLVIEAAERSDAGWYMCTPLTEKERNPASAITRLRVKDMYAALWPFLGICAEVFILCAIILVYEKRRTKPELDDSDTDNHDQ
ncbi:immunoglobulin domain-containing protein [Phthorimaea operculella]|nr:immunoglobulin domain-containing protein [Phthorimaea operculella]